MQEILRINPAIKIIALAVVGAAVDEEQPARYIAGHLKPEFYSAYARYFVRYIEEMRRHGIHVSAVTPHQNEPHNPKNEPSMVMSATEQADFIKVLGPELQKGAPETEILCWDPQLRRAGISAHGAWRTRRRAPTSPALPGICTTERPRRCRRCGRTIQTKKVYFTEQWISAHDDFMGALRWHTKNIVVGSLRNWSRTALEWNLASDPEYAPAHAPRRRGSAGRRYHRDHDQAPPRRLGNRGRCGSSPRSSAIPAIT